MCDIPVFYATTEGQTRRIAERIAQTLRTRGFESQAIDVGSPDAWKIDWRRVRAAVLGASLHVGKHQPSAFAFAHAHAGELNACPSAFFSVSLSARSKNPSERVEAQRLAEKFAAEAQWQPRSIACIAGRLAYTRYGFFTRLLMRMIAKREGGSTDTSRDHEYTDWAEVERLANSMADVLRRTPDAIAIGA
jgi:menaquinone-dependent protoporphyrinogen oxidase